MFDPFKQAKIQNSYSKLKDVKLPEKDMTLDELKRLSVSGQVTGEYSYTPLHELAQKKQAKIDKEHEEEKRNRVSPKPWPMQIRESVELTDEEREAHIYEFIEWCYKLLNIKNKPQFDLSYDTEEAQGNHHTGSHSGNSIWVYVKNRNLVDILRTVIHELTHQRQTELNMIKPEDSYPGSPIEMLADMVAGKYIKVWGKMHPEIFQ